MSRYLQNLPCVQEFFTKNPNVTHILDLFEYLPGIYFYAKDTQSRFMRVNGPFLQSHGMNNLDEILGKTDRDFHTPAMAEAYIAEDKRVMEGREAIPNQVWLVPHWRGTPRWFLSSKTPLFDQDNVVMGIAGAMYLIDTPEEQRELFGDVHPAIAYMEKNYEQPIAMDDMAQRAGLSIAHFNRRFKAILRMTPGDYLLALRIQAAQRLLVETTYGISDVASRVGFYDQSHFTKRFRRETGLTPLAYRKQFR